MTPAETDADFLRIVVMPEKDMAVLEVRRDTVEMSDWHGFVRACTKLLRTSQGHLVLDLRKVGSALSFLIGTAIEMNMRAQQEGRRLTVLAVGSLADVFKSALGAKVLKIVTNGRPPSDLD